MKSTLVGHTGFVGSNLLSSHKFTNTYNSKNIHESFLVEHDLVVYAGVRAEKYLANNNPDADFDNIQKAIENIIKINPKKLVLISTIDVYPKTISVDEDSTIDPDQLQAYGRNRYLLEQWVQHNVKDHLIVRLPALFGNGLKKNFLYDFLNVAPTMIKPSKMEEIRQKFLSVDRFYIFNDNGFYTKKKLDETSKKALDAFFSSNNFNSLSFTDSRSSYQFYNLEHLWHNISTALEKNIRVLNITSEPIITGKLYRLLAHKDFVNEILDEPLLYDIKSKHYKTFNGENGYLFDKEEIEQEIKSFIGRLSL